MIASGWVHSCAIATGGGVRCWGANDAGFLGVSIKEYATLPEDMAGAHPPGAIPYCDLVQMRYS